MLAAEHPECLHSHSLRFTISASQRYLTADVGKKYTFMSRQPKIPNKPAGKPVGKKPFPTKNEQEQESSVTNSPKRKISEVILQIPVHLEVCYTLNGDEVEPYDGLESDDPNDLEPTEEVANRIIFELQELLESQLDIQSVEFLFDLCSVVEIEYEKKRNRTKNISSKKKVLNEARCHSGDNRKRN